MGVELEIDQGGKDRDNAKTLCDIANSNGEHIYVKADGSLDNGMEIVTHPMTLDYHLNHMPWQSLLDCVMELGYQSDETETCGLHIHINRNSFGEETVLQDIHISRILYLIEKFWHKLLRFSRRTQQQLEKWARRYGYEDSPVTLYNKAKHENSGRYRCVNLENHATIEFRFFRGTLNYEFLIATLQLDDEICNVAILMSDEELLNLSWLDFVQQIDCSKHPVLTSYIKRRFLY